MSNNRALFEIAADISTDWCPMGVAAKPYWAAMREIKSINDMYGCDSAKSVVLYFLANAGTWRGPVARQIKAELKGMCNGKQ